MDEWLTAIKCWAGLAGEYWKWLAGVGVTGPVLCGLAFRAMISRIARLIEKHIEEINETTRRREGPALPIIEERLGYSTRRQNAHRCSVECIRHAGVVGLLGRWLIEPAFRKLHKDDRVVIDGGAYYAKGTEPTPV